jgi:serine/threonine-protein kinase
VAGQDAVDGTPFGRYRLVELLGHGGMGEVWRAFDTATERVVALKVLPANFADDHVFQERFRREARSAAGLDEPHVVPIHDFGEIEARFFVSMRLIQGQDLHTLLIGGAVEPTRAVGIIGQIAAALHAAHRIGLVHRDVKPSNILVGDDDFAYLIDFGIARAAGETGLTNTGTTVGTWAYMAPERFKTGAADARADVYSLACVLYECLTGSQPYPGQSLQQQMHAHLYLDPPRPCEKRPVIPTGFDDVVARGMAKEPDRRFATTKDLADAARAALSTETAVAPATKPAYTADATRPAQPLSTPPGSRSKPPGTRQFSQRWPNPEGTDYTPYMDHVEQAETSRQKRNFGAGQMALAIGGVALLTAALVAALWLIFSRHTESPGNPSGTPNATPTQSTTPTSSRAAFSSVPGTDSQGFIDYPGARCDPGNEPAVMARTTLSVLVVCQLSPGNYYYRAVRISDGASIELANAVRTSAGFDVTNPADNSLRQVRPTYVRIVFPGVTTQTEPMVDYASK